MFLVFLALRTLVTYHDSNFVVLKKNLISQASHLTSHISNLKSQSHEQQTSNPQPHHPRRKRIDGIHQKQRIARIQ
jgi:hypothetical protein